MGEEKPKNKDADPAPAAGPDLDEALDETFPASDPPATTQPGAERPRPA